MTEPVDNDNRRTNPANGFRLGSISGIPIYASTSWLVVVVVLIVSYVPSLQRRLPDLALAHIYLLAAGFVALLFLSVLAHELGHALTARRLGVPVRGMTLWMLGGFTEMQRDPATPAREFFIAAAGPGVSVLLGAVGWVAYLVVGEVAVVSELLWQLAISNIVLAIFNLLPGLPLDGGSLVRAAAWRLTGNRNTGTIAAAWSGRGIALAVFALGILLTVGSSFLGIGLSITGLILTLMVSVFLWFAATAALRMSKISQRASLLTVGQLARRALTVDPQLPLSEALRLAREGGHQAIVTVTPAGEPLGVLSEAAVVATPVNRHPWISVAELSQTISPALVLPATDTGEQLLEVLRDQPAPQYVVVADSMVVGVLITPEALAKLEKA